jgi:EAL domain-containing protein (putative c-di-GMP-specific phosphodiesterase class I)
MTMLISEMEEYYSSNNYGTSAFRLEQFYKLLNNNLLEYHFQPIINAATGEIFAYEALMRANADDIDMQPLEIIEIASRENCLYEIEKRTLFNTLQAMNKYSDVFKTKKLFINSISSKQLKDEDFDRLYKEYGHLFVNLVIEITEATDIDEQNLMLLHKRLQQTNCQLALDDYGTGYANVSNLLNTNPNYIKIDQTILRYINIDEKKQLLVSNLISFASQNNIKVIAEGIESYDELEYVINLGVDYIQGFYTARPNPSLIDTMSDDILKKIQGINYKRLCLNSVKKIYETKNEAFLSPVAIAFERYTDIIINEREITLKGNLGMTADTSILIPNNRNCRLVLDNINLQGNDRPAIIIGKNCSVLIELVGDNYLLNNGIRLPETSELIITGEGNLTTLAVCSE